MDDSEAGDDGGDNAEEDCLDDDPAKGLLEIIVGIKQTPASKGRITAGRIVHESAV